MENANKDKIHEAWNVLLSTMKKLDESIAETEVDGKLVPRALILAQQLNNQFDFVELEYKIPNDIVGKTDFQNTKLKRDELYKRLHGVFNKLTNEEMLKYLKADFDDRVSRYEMHIQGIDKIIPENIIDILELRDEIKFIYDELDVWTGRWDERSKRQETCDLIDETCKELGGHDVILRKYLSENKDKLPNLKEEAKKRLIVVPDGSKRFDFWWWYTIEI